MKAGATLMIVVILLAGCARFGAEGPGRSPSGARPSVIEMLRFSDQLAAASPRELASMPARQPAPAEEADALLRHALWLATPGHDGHDPVAARAALESLRTASTELEASTRSLVRLHLRHLQRQVELARENTELSERNTRLREKIQALTTLERQMGGNGADDGDGESR